MRLRREEMRAVSVLYENVSSALNQETERG